MESLKSEVCVAEVRDRGGELALARAGEFACGSIVIRNSRLFRDGRPLGFDSEGER